MVEVIVLNVNLNKEYRSFALREFTKEEDKNYIVSGYATTFRPYELMERDGIKIYERIEPNALMGADMTDVIMQYNHEGRVLARTSNGTLVLNTDKYGLHVRADLSKSNASRELYEDIAEGLITKMSWAFVVAEEEYSKDTRTRIIKRIKKVYDVSIVSIPANTNTTIGTDKRKDILKSELERKKQILRMKIKMFDL